MTTVLRGRAAVSRMKAILKSTFHRIHEVDAGAIELRSDFARYLSILVAGFAEASVRELAQQACRHQSSPAVASFAEAQLRWFRNVDKERLLQLVGSFSQDMRQELEDGYSDELEALSSVVNDRHVLSHGGTVGVTYAILQRNFEMIERLADRLTDYFDPEA